MDKNNKKFAPKDFNENNNSNNFHFIIDIGSEDSGEEKSNEKNIPNEEKEGLGYTHDKEEGHLNIPDPNNDIKTEQIDDNFEKNEEEINKSKKTLIYPIFKFNNDSDIKERGK